MGSLIDFFTIPLFFYLYAMEYSDLVYGNITSDSVKFLNADNVFTSFYDRYNDRSFPSYFDSTEEISYMLKTIESYKQKKNWKKIKQFIELCDGSLDETLKVHLGKIGIPFDKKYIDKLVKIAQDFGGLIMQLKVHYQRPRPYQVAWYSKQPLHPMSTFSGQSPAFPSGHASQGRFLTKVITQDHPSKRIELSKLSEQISKSRVLMGVHYPSDNVFGEEIACELFKEKSVQDYLDNL